MAAQEEGSHFYDLENIPLGVRFVPEDVELLHYLLLKIHNKPIPIGAIMDVELYKYHPRDLCQRSNMYGKNEWYFFTSIAMNGGRPNRTAANGFWRATRGDESVQNNIGQEVGCKKVLVYYEGCRSVNQKTNWIMHEFSMKDVANDKMLRVCRIYYRMSKSSINTEEDRQVIAIQDNNKTHVSCANLVVTSNQNPLSSAFDQSYMQAGQSNNDQYPLVEPSNHMRTQWNIQRPLLPYPHPLAYFYGQHNPSLSPGTNMPGNCMAMEINDQYQPHTNMNDDVGFSPHNGTSTFAAVNGIDDNDGFDITNPWLSSSDLLSPADPSIHYSFPGDVGCSMDAGTSNFVDSASTNNANEYWFDQDMFSSSLGPTMLNYPSGEQSNWPF